MPQDVDPQQLTHLADATWQWAETFMPRLLAAVVMLVAGFIVASWVERALRRLLGRVSHVDPTLKPILGAAARYAVVILTVIAALSQLGIQTASLLAVVGAAGLAVGLALQGTLSNIAAGIMLLWLRPFRVGDYIDNGGVAGTVKQLGLFASELHSWDGIYQFVPNSELWNKRIINYSRLSTRLVDLAFGVSYADDLSQGQEALRKLASEDARVASE
ncbi:MAG: mechanosensitive ion channel family protein, partial [Stellaceae bacterium]